MWAYAGHYLHSWAPHYAKYIDKKEQEWSRTTKQSDNYHGQRMKGSNKPVVAVNRRQDINMNTTKGKKSNVHQTWEKILDSKVLQQVVECLPKHVTGSLLLENTSEETMLVHSSVPKRHTCSAVMVSYSTGYFYPCCMSQAHICHCADVKQMSHPSLWWLKWFQDETVISLWKVVWRMQ